MEVAVMRVLPKIGRKVKYKYILGKGKPYEQIRECKGVVVKIWESYNDDNTLAPEKEWAASVEVENPLPDWWPYPHTNRFAPDIKYLTPI
jgi:hypothetical protein